jgi:uncharacterized protein YbjT (DUF2867 family)
MSKLTAVMIGATGLVGSQLLSQLLDDDRFSSVISFGRKKTDKSHAKLEENIVDFEWPDTWSALVKGDVAFSSLGTTIGQAGSKGAQRKVDYDYQFEFAKTAAKNKIPTYVLVSSASANPDSMAFYSRIKGELDRDVRQLDFERVRIFRPSLLLGERKQGRIGEKIGEGLLGAVNAIGIGRKWRGIGADVVARAMINSALSAERGTKIFTLDEVFVEADRKSI